MTQDSAAGHLANKLNLLSQKNNVLPLQIHILFKQGLLKIQRSN